MNLTPKKQIMYKTNTNMEEKKKTHGCNLQINKSKGNNKIYQQNLYEG